MLKLVILTFTSLFIVIFFMCIEVKCKRIKNLFYVLWSDKNKVELF